MISMGPSFFHKVLHQDTYEKRCGIIAANRATDQDSLMWLLETMDREYENGFLLFPADKYDRDDIQSVLPSMPLIEQPNMAWIQHWYKNGTIDDIVPEGFYYTSFGNPEGWEWAYVLWDLEKLRSWNAPLLMG